MQGTPRFCKPPCYAAFMKQRPSITTPPALQQKSPESQTKKIRETIHTKDGRLSPQNLSDSDESFQLLLTSASLISRVSFFQQVDSFSTSNLYTRTPALLRCKTLSQIHPILILALSETLVSNHLTTHASQIPVQPRPNLPKMRPTTLLYTVILLATSALALPFPSSLDLIGLSSPDVALNPKLTESNQRLNLHQ